MSQPEVTFQRLGPSDAARLRELMAVFGDAFGEPRTYGAAPPSDAHITRLLGQPHVVVLAAIEGQRVVGGLVAYVLDKFEQDRRELYIYDLAVAEDRRRRGIARGLITTLQALAADELDAYVIFVQADLEDAPAIALYRSMGVQETAHHFDIPVPRR